MNQLGFVTVTLSHELSKPDKGAYVGYIVYPEGRLGYEFTVVPTLDKPAIDDQRVCRLNINGREIEAEKYKDVLEVLVAKALYLAQWYHKEPSSTGGRGTDIDFSDAPATAERFLQFYQASQY